MLPVRETLDERRRWTVAAFDLHPHLQGVWQHHILNAVPTLGMALPLLRALGWHRGRRDMRFVHTGVLQHRNVHLPGAQWLLNGTATKRSGKPRRVAQLPFTSLNRTKHFAMAFVAPYHGFISTRHGDATRGGDDWPDAARRRLAPPEVLTPEIAMPRAAYWPFGTRARPNHRAPFVAYISRQQVHSGRRRLANESAVLSELSTLFRELRIPFAAITEDAPSEQYRDACGVIGVHGGGLANIHVCAPGTVVIEIGPRPVAEAAALVGRSRGNRYLFGDADERPRWCFAALSRGLGLRHYVYYATAFPRGYFNKGAITVNATHLGSFAKELFEREPACRRRGQPT